ncbi:DUF4149 domain-containing protein [Roseivivax marinus]|uniref:DUF4149 domain-containing protein n=1 Tax=Roseivivax marinus TaxID=1379903 RepID=UPI001F0391CE|nr:DUF4149 domain-containing protein [Roseivivax marinus]UMA65879.1 DUF4149 domain-containing protein [Roseivivax marinus]
MIALAVLLTGLLFGGMTFYSFAFAGFLFRHASPEEAGRLLRLAFPAFYLATIVTAGLAALAAFAIDRTAALLLFAVVLTTIPARQALMPAINCATDTGAKARFAWLHGASVALGLAQIAAAGWALLRLA